MLVHKLDEKNNTESAVHTLSKIPLVIAGLIVLKQIIFIIS